MPTIHFSPEELDAVESICRELDPAEHDLTKPFLNAISDDESRSFVTAYFRNCVRGELFAGLIGRGAYEAACEVMGVDGDVDEFMDSDFRARYHVLPDGRVITSARVNLWQYGLGCVGAEAFTANRILGPGEAHEALNALLDIANDRMFGSLERLYHAHWRAAFVYDEDE